MVNDEEGDQWYLACIAMLLDFQSNGPDQGSFQLAMLQETSSCFFFSPGDGIFHVFFLLPLPISECGQQGLR